MTKYAYVFLINDNIASSCPTNALSCSRIQFRLPCCMLLPCFPVLGELPSTTRSFSLKPGPLACGLGARNRAEAQNLQRRPRNLSRKLALKTPSTTYPSCCHLLHRTKPPVQRMVVPTVLIWNDLATAAGSGSHLHRGLQTGRRGNTWEQLDFRSWPCHIPFFSLLSAPTSCFSRKAFASLFSNLFLSFLLLCSVYKGADSQAMCPGPSAMGVLLGLAKGRHW